MSYDSWKCDDTPIQPENERGTQIGWWTQFRFAQQNGYAREFLDAARRFRTAPEQTVQQAEQELDDKLKVLVRLDVESGEPVR